MAIPDYQTLMLPLLKIAGDRQEHAIRDCIDTLSSEYELTEEERGELLESGQQTIMANRVSWACTYLKKAGLLESTRRAFFRITPRGSEVLSHPPSNINNRFLEQFPEYLEFRSPRSNDEPASTTSDGGTDKEKTPQEEIEEAYLRIRRALATEILGTIVGCSAERFERLVVDLLLKMGYGGTRLDAGQAIGRSGDGGIDGIIKEDRLGLDAIYVQAKCWTGNGVGRPEVQKFAGALQGHRARKGVFITTSHFSREAIEYVGLIDSKIVLIDGKTLAELMIDYGLGVTTVASYEVKRLDSDYFQDSE